MSESQEIAMKEGLDPLSILPALEEKKVDKIEPITKNLGSIEDTMDSQTYFLGEVPQSFLVDPFAFLPLNSDRLVGSSNSIEKILFEAGLYIDEEVNSIQKQQKRISFWEDRIEKNRAQVKKNEQQMKQNNTDALYDKKNRDYWFGRSEEVEIDYAHAEVASRHQDWAWLIKKYGLKNANGTEIDSKNACVEELCNGEIKNLAAAYRATGDKYEFARKDKEIENSRLVRENASLNNTNDMLQTYITAAYTNEIEPLQDGVLLLKELCLKLKTMPQDATYGDLRAWAEPYLSEFIKTNSRVSQEIVINFRKLTSIPLPPEYC
jgi:hypothetical protein